MLLLLVISQRFPPFANLSESEVYDAMRWLPNKEAAEVLGVSCRTLYQWRVAGRLLPGVHYGRSSYGRTSRLYIDVDAVHALMSSIALQ